MKGVDMSDHSQGNSNQDKLTELQQTGEAMGQLAADEAAFTQAAEAFRAQDAAAFQGVLTQVGVLQYCRLICSWFCSKHCVFYCSRLCREPNRDNAQVSIAEWREFALVTAKLAKDTALLERFLAVVASENADEFERLLAELKWQRYCHQLCHYLCGVRCRLACRLLCPPPPLITEVSLLPTSQFTESGPGMGLAAGPSFPPGPTQPDNKPAGVGDHPIGGLSNIRGAFVIASPFQYKVEYATSTAGPWTPILTPIQDLRFNPAFPPPPIEITYMRVPDAAGWYNVADMGLLGLDYLTDWQTPAAAVNDQYFLKLTVRNAALAEFVSPIVPVRVDNTAPTKPSITLQLQMPDGSRKKLGCCETVKQGDGNLVIITLEASDANFSQIAVELLGGCGASYDIVDTGGTNLSKTYNGDITDTGYPVPTEFAWNPWAAKISPCCYLIDVRIYDRAVVDDSWSGGHSNENWQSITIA
jgi:hypothetical protein